MEKISTLVEGGKANAGPPLGPALGPLPVNIGEVVNAINEQTESFAGMEVPVEVSVDEETGDFEIDVGLPPTAALIKERAEIDKGSGEPNRVKIANMALKDMVEIADMKRDDLVALDHKGATLEVLGTAHSMGIMVDGKQPNAVQAEIRAGDYDAVFAGEEELPDEAKGEAIDAEAAKERMAELEAEREAEAEEEEEELEDEEGEELEEGEEPAEDEESEGDEEGEEPEGEEQ